MWNTIDVGGRCAVVKLQDGSLWVHSPVALDDNLREALAELGEVKHVVVRFTPCFFSTQRNATLLLLLQRLIESLL